MLLILKMGDTLPSLKSRKGDFEDWIMSGLGLTRDHVTVVNVPGGEPLPQQRAPAGVVITGSHAMVTERREWSERTGDWLRAAIDAGVPVLGICYGHQLLAHALGGVVGDNPKGREFGTVDVTLEEGARDDMLLGVVAGSLPGGHPRRIRVQVGHTQSVLRLPAGAMRLASNPWDVNQAARFGPAAGGCSSIPSSTPRSCMNMSSTTGLPWPPKARIPTVCCERPKTRRPGGRFSADLRN